MNNIKLTSQKLLSQLLCRRQMSILISTNFVLISILSLILLSIIHLRLYLNSLLLKCMLIQSVLLLLHLIYLRQLLQLLLVLHLLGWTGVLHVLNDESGLLLELFALFLEAFLLEVRNKHSSLFSFQVQKSSDGSLNFNSG